MSEYWKSTPNYWCKFCSKYVRDTKFDRQAHEQTGRHQGAVRRSINDIHKNMEREKREKEQTQRELERLNRVVGGKPSGSPSVASSNPVAPKMPQAPPRQATAEERKRQMEQLIAMGVAAPQEFRKEHAIPGEWERVAIKPVYSAPQDEDSKESVEVKGPIGGARKRRSRDDDDEEEEVSTKRKAPSHRTYAYRKEADQNLDALLGGVTVINKESEIKKDDDAAPENDFKTDAEPHIKKEESLDVATEGAGFSDVVLNTDVKMEPAPKSEETLPGAGIVFKKRKAKLKT